MNGRPVERVNEASGQFLQSLIAGTEAGSTMPTGGKRQALSVIDAAKQRVVAARRTADNSLDRAKAAPKPHEISNPAFVALFEAHQRDREMLFEAMRALEKAQSGSVSHAR
ncbi:hypothetical protein J2X72_003858 [Phyllobacterium sp. 1468]|uniref:hypothetical protein n=1 Tax=Phyllobacterium sp. 1468 TaxID=2817759 RepID=UPI00285D420A|nr:hypothetical protein [Phyllobacterium sp. 1468]MDR6635046.1 hypothetical protein [Phyllobacterium sp. 1468]